MVLCHVIGCRDKVLNKAIDLCRSNFIFRLTIYCGHSTELAKKLDRFDEERKAHDIACSKYNDSEHRREVNIILEGERRIKLKWGTCLSVSVQLRWP